MTKRFGWLHLSDLHCGQTGHSRLWPNIEEEFFRDLGVLHDSTGPWHIVFFTGDLTQSGAREEFDALDLVLQQIWKRCAALGSHPLLVAVPGNHDLMRSPNFPISELGNFLTDASAQRAFWDAATSAPLRTEVHRAFSNYQAWWNSPAVPRIEAKQGLMPGDYCATVRLNQMSIGIVGLNSAALQLDPSIRQRQLLLDAEQLHAAARKAGFRDGAEFTREHDFCFLLTHHSPEWLSESSMMALNGEIARPGRFLLHLFGHMHANRSESVSAGGDAEWRRVQGSSMFGLQHFGNGANERRHGYSAGVLVESGSTFEFRMWPRLAGRSAEGVWRIAPEGHEFRLQADNGTFPVIVAPRRIAPTPPSGPTGGITGMHAEHARRAFARVVEDALKRLPRKTALSHFTATLRQDRYGTGEEGGLCLEYPVFYAPSRPELAVSINALITARVNQTASDFVASFEDALNEERAGDALVPSSAWQSSLKVRIGIVQDDFLSLVFDHFFYLGGAHGGTERRPLCAVLDGTSFVEVTLQELMPTSPRWPLVVSGLCVAELRKQEASMVVDGDVDSVEDLLGRFLVGQEGLIVMFDEYEVACYAEGRFEVAIPFEVVRGLVQAA